MNTEITIPLPELKEALHGLNKMVGRKITLPVLGCVKVSRNQKGAVTLQATDLDGHATYTLNENQPGAVIEALVPLQQLNKAFKCSGNSEAVALIVDGGTTKIRYCIGGSPVQQPVNTPPLSEWPECPVITAEAAPLQLGFGESLRQAMQCCSQDESRYVLRGACLDAFDPKAHYIVATNGRFLYSANTFNFPLKEPVIIPDSKFITDSGLLDYEPCFVAVQSIPIIIKGAKPKTPPEPVKYAQLQSKQWQFVTRQIDGNYPHWKHNMPEVDEQWTKIQLGKAAVEQLLKGIPNLPGLDHMNCTIRLRVGDGCVQVEGRNKDDTDWTSIAIQDVTIIGKAQEICLNRNYFIPALKFGLTELAILDELTPMVCSRVGKKMVIMPVRPPLQPQEPAPAQGPAPAQTQSTPTSAVKPPTPEVPTKADERKTEVSKSTTPETTTTPDSPFKLAMAQVDGIRESLKSVLRDLATVTDTLKLAEKEKRATDKEIEQFREKVREIQGIKI